MTAPTFEIDGARWGIAEWGAGPRTLVAIPGAQGTGDVFAPMAMQLAGSLRIIGVTPPALADADRLSRGLVALVERLALERCALLGTSLGGYLAQFAAVALADRLDRLFLANTFRDPTLNPKRRPASDVEREDPQTLFEAAVTRLEALPSGAVRDALRAGLERQGPDAFKARLLTLARGGRAPLVAGVPTTIMTAADDAVIAPELRDDLFASYPEAQRVTLPAGGHYPYLYDPARYGQTVARALDEPIVA